MPADRPPGRQRGVAGIATLGLAVCCGLPVLLTVGAGVTIVGLGLRSWLLILAGLGIVVAGVVWRRRHQRSVCPRGPARRER